VRGTLRSTAFGACGHLRCKRPPRGDGKPRHRGPRDFSPVLKRATAAILPINFALRYVPGPLAANHRRRLCRLCTPRSSKQRPERAFFTAAARHRGSPMGPPSASTWR